MKKLIYIDDKKYNFDGEDFLSVSELTEDELVAKFQGQFVVIKETDKTYNCF